MPDSKNSYYLDFGFTHDFGGGFGLVAHYGIFKFKNVTDGDYNDWKLGVTYDLSGWVLGAAYVDTDAKATAACPSSTASPMATARRPGRRQGTVVFSVMKTF